MAKRGSFPRERNWTVHALAVVNGRVHSIVERVIADTPNLAVMAAEAKARNTTRIDSMRVTHLVMEVDVLDRCGKCGTIITPHDKERKTGDGRVVCSDCADWRDNFQ